MRNTISSDSSNLSPDSLPLSPVSSSLSPNSKVFIAGHTGMVGSAIWRNLESKGYTNLIGKSSKELDLRNQQAVTDFFEKEKPEFVILAAAKVGGILANDTYRAEFIYDNLQIQNNVIHQSYVHGVKKLLFLGSSCIYPRNCPQPMKEEYLLTGELEPTNEPYAIAKIAGIKMCESYNRQYGTNFISAMPTNLYGPGDNYDLEKSHVLPALLRKFHLGKCLEENNWESIKSDLTKNPINGFDGSASKEQIFDLLKSHGITITQPDSLPPDSYLQSPAAIRVVISLWGTGTPLREFLHVDDLANACTFLMEKNNIYNASIKSRSSDVRHSTSDICDLPPVLNIGSGKEISIKDLASHIKEIVGFKGEIQFNNTKPDGIPRKLLETTLLNQMGWEYNIELNHGIQSVYKIYKRKNIE